VAGIHDVTSYNFNRTDRVVVDTNVLILVHANSYGDPKGWRVTTYSSSLNKIYSVKAEAILLDVVLSEFINGVERAAATDWAHRQQKNGLMQREILKQFRQDTQLYKRAIEDIRIAVDQVARACTFDRVLPLDPNTAPAAIDEMRRARADLNDVRIAHYCKAKGVDLITDDRDMATFGSSINVITSPSRP